VNLYPVFESLLAADPESTALLYTLWSFVWSILLLPEGKIV